MVNYGIPRHKIIPHFHECDVCCKNITSANHYCHDCRTIFCNECTIKEQEEVTVCSECGINLFSTDEKTGELYCKQCRNDDNLSSKLVNILKDRSVCPKCHSPNTSDIKDLKMNLKDKYKNIIIDCRNVLDDFQNFTNFLSMVKQKLLKLRLEKPCIKHEPQLESDLTRIMEESSMIERRIMNRINNFFLFLKSKQPYFMSNKPWQNEDIAVLETYINRLDMDFINFLGQVTESFNQPLDGLSTLKNRLEYLLNIQKFFNKYINKGVIHLDRDEYPIIYVEDVKLDSDQEEHKGKGHILITNRNLKFIKSMGYIRKTDALLFSFPVNKLLSTDIKGKVFKKLVMQFQGIGLRLSMERDEMQLLIKYLEQLLDYDTLNPLDEGKIQTIRNFDINSVFKIKSFIENNINLLLNSQEGAIEPGMKPQLNPNIQTFDQFDETESLDQQKSKFTNLSTQRPTNRTYGYGKSNRNVIYKTNPKVLYPSDFQSKRHQQQIQNTKPQKKVELNHSYDNIRRWEGSIEPENHVDSHFSPETVSTQSRLEENMQKLQEKRYLLNNMLQSFENKHHSIQETLRNLEHKFELGKVAPNVYFQTHQLFSEKLYKVQKEMQELKIRLQKINHPIRY